ncbi:hypothetical protein U9M48_004604 [Paspalum notatum var. saurae]|uniref:CCHC-type domain-containing protein n=1 Tax=Paspalum notatum var. saurae TaxID=547442 RepID=A0AAQ3PK75_PASNO
MEKGKSKKKTSSSSSEEEEKEDSDEDEDDQAQRSSSDDDDEEIAMLIKRMEKALKKLNSKGIPITIEEIEHNRQRKKERRGGCSGCGQKGHYMDSCPIIAKEQKKKKRHKLKKKEKEQRDRHKALMSIGTWVDVSSDEDHHKKHSHKSTSCKSSSISHKCLMAHGCGKATRSKGASPTFKDNRPKVVKKLESQTVVCFFCNKEGHKSYMCKLKRREEAIKREGKQKKAVTPKTPGRNCVPKQACKELNKNREGKIKYDQKGVAA